MAKVYENFKDVAEEVKSKVPQISYKYRNWELSNHRSILKNNKIWFAHPKDLNDPYDIRIPVRFNYDEINDPLFLEKLKVLGRGKLYWIDPNSREFRALIENRLELIKQNPKAYFEENYLNLRNSNAYDRIGVFSLTQNCLDETMWAYYGKNSEGFCIGFDTVELLRSLPLSFGFADYNDTPPLHSFIKSIEENDRDEGYLKHSKWKHEQEFRILNYNIINHNDRQKLFPKSAIREVLIGERISAKNINEIIEVLKSEYNSKVVLYQAVAGSSYGFRKKGISY